MAFNEVKEELDEIKKSSEAYINTSLKYYRLWGFKVSVKVTTQFMTFILLSLFIMMALFFLSLATAFAIGSALKSYYLGFLIVGAFYILITIIAYSCRKTIVERPVIKKLSEIILND
ncbi:MAG: phage holin family protein [Flavobacteriaceae bacterium]|jgi:ABC-type multidrug transport system fused ATPase/permease subunit|nr:phage holin family protein [Flavobacteriaceae bacterium]